MPIARFAIALMLVAAAALGVEAADRREGRPVSGFSAIALATDLKLVVVQGDTESLVLEGDERALAELKLVISGSGDIRIGSLAASSLDVTVSGRGDVRYYGDPAVTKAVAGSGSVRRAGAAPS